MKSPTFFRSFQSALRGLRITFREERNFKIEIVCAILVIIIAYNFGFSLSEWIVSFIAIFMVLSAELINTAGENICDKISPNNDPAIGKIKDMLAAYVLVSAIGASILGAIIFIRHFWF